MSLFARGWTPCFLSVPGTSGSDAITGGFEATRLAGNGGNDTIRGSSGTDTPSGDFDADLAFVTAGADIVEGEIGNDLLHGGGLEDTLVGGYGSDTLVGGAGADSLAGDDGSDLLTGSLGADTPAGGAGADTFAYDAALEGRDLILGVESGLDALRISAVGFGGELAAGMDPGQVGRFVLSAAATSAEGQFLNDAEAGPLSFDADGTGPDAAAMIAVFDQGVPLVAGDLAVLA